MTTSRLVNDCNTEKEVLSGDIANYLADVKPLVKKLTTVTEQVEELKRYSQYLHTVGHIEDLR